MLSLIFLYESYQCCKCFSNSFFRNSFKIIFVCVLGMSYSVAQAGFELMEILLPQSPESWDYMHKLPHQVKNVITQ